MTTFVVALALFGVVYNNLPLIRELPRWTYAPINVTVAAALVGAGAAAGLDASGMGFAREGVAPGLRWGLGALAVIALGLAVAPRVPRARAALRDRRVTGLTPTGLAYETLVRIPIGTALLEEVAFRGVLFGAVDAISTTGAAVVVPSLVFGLWHIAPTLETIRTNGLDGDPRRRGLLVVASVVATALGGALFALLRVRTGAIWGSLVVHAGANSLATAAAWRHQRTAAAG